MLVAKGLILGTRGWLFVAGNWGNKTMMCRRERERGFNQSLLLARALANAWGLSVLPRAIRRVRFTQSQATLAAAERWENVAGAFAPASDLHLDHHTIFLIDDVFTTGATMKACAEALKSAGAGRVIGVALAKAGQLV